jgi:TonB family protein
MNKTQKKCLMASVGMHALLIAILAVAPAFLKKDVEINEPPIDFIPSIVVESLINPGGGGAVAKVVEERAAPPAPKPPVKISQPTPPPRPRQKPVVKKDPPKPPPPAPPKKSEPVKKPPVKIKPPPKPPIKIKKVVKVKPSPKKVKPPPKIKVDLSKITRLKKEDTAAKQRATQVARERDRQRAATLERARAAAAYAKTKTENEKAWKTANPTLVANAASKSAERIRSGLQPSLSVGLTGSGDAAYASYAQLVKTIYVAAIEAQGRQMGKLGDVIKVRITIARSGKVTEEKILSGPRSSGFGRAVQTALQRVDQIRPFSPGSTDTTRTYTINFRLPSN